MTSRSITHRYDDPLSLVWLDAARKLGIEIERSAHAYAAWDGKSTLSLSTPEHLDADDSLAQLVFHEICHALVAGPDGRRRPDWGLDNTGDRDLVYEHAVHRVQAALAKPYGLRDFFAVTTEWRAYWDALPDDPLSAADDPALPLARRAFAAANTAPFSEVLTAALEATARIAELVRGLSPDESLWRRSRRRHPSGFLAHTDTGLGCGGCAWSHARGSKGRALRCRQAERAGKPEVRVAAATPACELWEPKLDETSCASCGACCREGFDRVELVRRDVLKKKHPELVAMDDWGIFVPRPGGRCVALDGDGRDAPFRCRVYADRPKACADFAIAGPACLTARRRVGLTR